MNQQTEQGIVLEKIEPNWAKVQVPRTSNCEMCQHEKGCCDPFGDSHMVILAENQPKAANGQRVEVHFVSQGSGKAVTILYIIPLVAMIIGAILGHNLNFFGRADGSAAFLGFAFLFLSFLGIYGFNRMFWATDARLQPRITRIVPVPEARRAPDPSLQRGAPSGKSCSHCH